MEYSTFQPDFTPLADPKAVVAGPHVRFSLLTDRLIRMEYSPVDQFEDRPSQIFWYRRQPVPSFSSTITDSTIEIETEYIHLHYTVTKRGFTPNTLQVEIKTTGARWRFGEPAGRSGNLFGTARTLDEAAGRIRLENGLMARSGWTIVDDSSSLVFNADGWLEERPATPLIDLYLFGYGHDYTTCLRDYCRIAGAVPMIPRWALGNWWSRYWAYSSAELINLTREFKENQVPLSVCIVDMDWHLTETNNTCTGWTGYTWNRKLFPDPDGFLQAIHRLGLKTALNLHPAEGIHPHEEQYGAFAEYMGIDPITEDPILFDSTDPQFMCGYFELLHHPLEAQGVDFWWLDWQQGTQTKQRGLDPLWWLNHLHFYDLGRDRVRRPFIFSRWGGLGNHRYPIGFSGDTVVGWEALDFQPGFTATAANVGYGWWSHDIGGHMRGIEDDELFIRWVQYGVFSPILRLHSTNNPFHERRPWGRGMLAEKLVGSALRFRHRLIPYLYSMAWRNSQTGLPLITPLYYTHPEHEDAYQCPQAYWFGSELIAAPFTLPADADTHLSRQIVWLPEISGVEASCFDFYSGERLKSGWRTIYGSLEDIPVFARPGAIIPLGPVTGEFGTPNPESLNLHIFPGADNLFELYEDDGETIDYQKGCYAITPFTEKWSGHTLEFRIGPVRGDLSLVPPIRTFELSLHCLRQPDRVDINLNGSSMNLDLHYDEERAILILDPFQLQPNDELIVRCSIVRGLLRADRNHTIQKLNRYIKAFHLNTQTKAMILQDWSEIASGRLSLRNLRGLTESQIIALESLFD